MDATTLLLLVHLSIILFLPHIYHGPWLLLATCYSTLLLLSLLLSYYYCLLSYYSFQLLAAVLIKSDLVLIKAGCWRCTPPSLFFCFVLEVGRWGEVWGGSRLTPVNSPLCKIVNCCHHILMSLLLRVGAKPHASETRHTSVSHRKEFSMPKHAYLII